VVIFSVMPDTAHRHYALLSVSKEADNTIEEYGGYLGTIKHESTYFSDYTISKVCEYFKLRREDLRCYIRKLSKKGHWL